MIVLVGGVAGSGKTTVGVLLADMLHWRFADADAFHSQASIAKMRSGVPLTDADRKPWLNAITTWMDERIATGESAVAGCSALKQRYRDLLLSGRPEARMDSQFAELEPPQESPQLIVLDAAKPPSHLAVEIAARLGLVADET